MQAINARTSISQTRFSVASFLADAIVLLFPIVLTVMYVYGITKNVNIWKEYALRVFSSTVVAVCINLIIQLFFDKARPETVLEWTQRLILQHLPTMSFPSDHAAVWLSFAVALLVFARLLQGTHMYVTMRRVAVFFIIGGIVMSIARVAVGIHWPTDIIAWWIVACIAVAVTKNIPEGIFLHLVRFEKNIFSFLYK